VGVREKTDFADMNRNGRARRESAEHGFQFIEAGLRPLPDEFCSDVQVFGRTPVDPCGGLKMIEKRSEAADHFVGKIESREQSHERFPL
jgi:hypothetical protein